MEETRRCAGIRRDGGRCATIVNGEAQEYCYQHDPAYAERRKEAASKGGKAKNGEISIVKTRLRGMVEDVVSGKLSTARGSVAAQLLGVYLRAVEAERRAKEVEEFEARLEELENLLERDNQGRRTTGWAG